MTSENHFFKLRFPIFLTNKSINSTELLQSSLQSTFTEADNQLSVMRYAVWGTGISEKTKDAQPDIPP